MTINNCCVQSGYCCMYRGYAKSRKYRPEEVESSIIHGISRLPSRTEIDLGALAVIDANADGNTVTGIESSECTSNDGSFKTSYSIIK